MSQDDHSEFNPRGARQSRGASVLAVDAVARVNKQQAVTEVGARQFILDHLLRAVTSPKAFDPSAMLDELRGHRLSVDIVIDVYVPAIARILGEMWLDNQLDFAGVTVGSMRLQSLLSVASAEMQDFQRPTDTSYFMLIVVPEGEQHSLGAFVLAAQLRRLGARVDMSFCEQASDFVSRVICAPPDMILFSASCIGSLETVSQLVLDTTKVLSDKPLFALGGYAGGNAEMTEDMLGIDLFTNSAKEALAFTAHSHDRPAGKTGI